MEWIQDNDETNNSADGLAKWLISDGSELSTSATPPTGSSYEFKLVPSSALMGDDD